VVTLVLGFGGVDLVQGCLLSRRQVMAFGKERRLFAAAGSAPSSGGGPAVPTLLYRVYHRLAGSRLAAGVGARGASRALPGKEPGSTPGRQGS
jgi:hypothetical protein